MSDDIRISEMELGELKDYACPKVQHKREWYMECLSCAGVSGCSAGQRVWVLLNEQTKPAGQKAMTTKQQKAYDDMKAAVESGDPKQWLIDHGLTKNAVAVRMCDWRKKYPEYMKDIPKVERKSIGGSRKVASEEARDRCKLAIASGDPAKFLMDQEGITRKIAAGRIYLWKKRYPELFANIELPDGRKGRNERKEKAFYDYQQAVNSGDPVQWIMKNRGVSRKVARNRMYDWKNKFGELRKGEGAVTSQETIAPEDDDISMDQFLSELEASSLDIDTKLEADQEIEEVHEPEKPEERKPDQPEVVSWLDEKFNVLTQQRDRIIQEIERLKGELEWIRKQQEALSLVRAMSDQSTAIGKQLSAVSSLTASSKPSGGST